MSVRDLTISKVLLERAVLGAVGWVVMMLTKMLQAVVVALLGMHVVVRLLLLLVVMVGLGEDIQGGGSTDEIGLLLGPDMIAESCRGKVGTVGAHGVEGTARGAGAVVARSGRLEVVTN